MIVAALLIGVVVSVGTVAGRDWALFLAIPLVLFTIIRITRPDPDKPYRPRPSDYEPPGASPF